MSNYRACLGFVAITFLILWPLDSLVQLSLSLFATFPHHIFSHFDCFSFYTLEHRIMRENYSQPSPDFCGFDDSFHLIILVLVIVYNFNCSSYLIFCMVYQALRLFLYCFCAVILLYVIAKISVVQKLNSFFCFI